MTPDELHTITGVATQIPIVILVIWLVLQLLKRQDQRDDEQREDYSVRHEKYFEELSKRDTQWQKFLDDSHKQFIESLADQRRQFNESNNRISQEIGALVEQTRVMSDIIKVVAVKLDK